MKLLQTLGFLLLLLVWLILQREKARTYLREAQQETTYPWRILSIEILVWLSPIAQFWVLTGVFHPLVVVMLVLLTCLNSVIYSFLGLVAGFTRGETNAKTRLLWLMYSYAYPTGVFWPNTVFILTTAGTLFALWYYPVGSPQAQAVIALLLFVVPSVYALLFAPKAVWPILTSQYLDDDVRNPPLARGFLGLLPWIGLLFYPAYLLDKHVEASFIQGFQFFWLVATAPLVIFFFLHILPFFIGTFRYRHEAYSLLEWRRTWLSEVSEILHRPQGEERQKLLSNKLQKLWKELVKTLKHHKVFRVFSGPPALKLQELRDEVNSDHDDSEQEQSDKEQVCRVLTNNFENSFANSIRTGQGLMQRGLELIHQHKRRLEEWDIGVRHILALANWYPLYAHCDSATVSLAQIQLQRLQHEISSLYTRTNALVAILTLLFTSSISIGAWFAQIYYEDQIRKIIGGLIDN